MELWGSWGCFHREREGYRSQIFPWQALRRDPPSFQPHWESWFSTGTVLASVTKSNVYLQRVWLRLLTHAESKCKMFCDSFCSMAKNWAPLEKMPLRRMKEHKEGIGRGEGWAICHLCPQRSSPHPQPSTAVSASLWSPLFLFQYSHISSKFYKTLEQAQCWVHFPWHRSCISQPSLNLESLGHRQ